jgi:hypothetical protein
MSGGFRLPVTQVELCGNLIVVASGDFEDRDQNRDHHKDNPCALGGLGHRHDHQNNPGDDGAEEVYGRA